MIECCAASFWYGWGAKCVPGTERIYVLFWLVGQEWTWLVTRIAQLQTRVPKHWPKINTNQEGIILKSLYTEIRTVDLCWWFEAFQIWTTPWQLLSSICWELKLVWQKPFGTAPMFDRVWMRQLKTVSLWCQSFAVGFWVWILRQQFFSFSPSGCSSKFWLAIPFFSHNLHKVCVFMNGYLYRSSANKSFVFIIFINIHICQI